MGDLVQLVGLDFGSTTSSAVVASARLADNRVTGRRELREVTPIYQSALVFTPFVEDRIDLAAVRTLLDGWLGDVPAAALLGGGALITGLAATQRNAAELVALIRERLHDAVIATADDPVMESFVAFMGSCAALSRAAPESWILNLDIGGGTTNLALGRGGEVIHTGCLRVGARHLRFRPGSYVLTGSSEYGRWLLDHLGIPKQTGDALEAGEIDAVLDAYVALLAAACSGARTLRESPLGQKFEQVALRFPAGLPKVKLAFSGGVGALIHARLAGDTTTPTTCYGDLGPHLAERIVRSGLAAAGVVTGGAAIRATVYGLLAHSTMISGTTVFLARPDTLPLRELPILGRITSPCSEDEVHQALLLLRRSARGGALRVSLASPSPESLRALGTQLAAVLKTLAFPPEHPIVLLLAQNLGKVLGGYITGWRPPTVNLLVIDEVAAEAMPGRARFVQIGRLHDQVVPVSFYALQS